MKKDRPVFFRLALFALFLIATALTAVRHASAQSVLSPIADLNCELTDEERTRRIQRLDRRAESLASTIRTSNQLITEYAEILEELSEAYLLREAGTGLGFAVSTAITVKALHSFFFTGESLKIFGRAVPAVISNRIAHADAIVLGLNVGRKLGIGTIMASGAGVAFSARNINAQTAEILEDRVVDLHQQITLLTDENIEFLSSRQCDARRCSVLHPYLTQLSRENSEWHRQEYEKRTRTSRWKFWRGENALTHIFSRRMESRILELEIPYHEISAEIDLLQLRHALRLREILRHDAQACGQ